MWPLKEQVLVPTDTNTRTDIIVASPGEDRGRKQEKSLELLN